MAKVFRLHSSGDTSKSGWFRSEIRKKDLEEITTDAKEVSNSLPSPFAYWDLVNTAFKWVANPKQSIDGTSAYHKLVSEALDVAQLFFYSSRYKEIFKIIVWNPQEIKKLADEESKNEKHKKLMAPIWTSIWTYWKEDIKKHGMDAEEHLYFLIDKKKERIIGGTSPMSLFFPVPDASENISEKIDFGSHKLFDKKPTSLAKRSEDFIKYMMLLSMQEDFAEKFKSLYAYLEKVKKELETINEKLLAEINQMQPENINNYEPCTHEGGGECIFLNIPLKIAPAPISSIQQHSDFVINSDYENINSDIPLPLVLPTKQYVCKGWTYTEPGKEWKPDWKLPTNKNETQLQDSTLPFEGIKYPWLTEGNFLEDKIVEIPYTVDKEKFIVYELKRSMDPQPKYFLPPLTKTFFKYFKAENISKLLKVEIFSGGGIKVTLNIPVRKGKGKITFERVYNSDAQVKAEGFHLAILPFFKVKNETFPYYVGVIDARKQHPTIPLEERALTFFNGNKIINTNGPTQRRKEGPKT